MKTGYAKNPEERIRRAVIRLYAKRQITDRQVTDYYFQTGIPIPTHQEVVKYLLVEQERTIIKRNIIDEVIKRETNKTEIILLENQRRLLVSELEIFDMLADYWESYRLTKTAHSEAI